MNTKAIIVIEDQGDHVSFRSSIEEPNSVAAERRAGKLSALVSVFRAAVDDLNNNYQRG